MSVKTKQSRQKAAREGMTLAQKVCQQFTGGKPPVSALRTPVEAVQAARILLQGLTTAMEDAKPGPDDVRVAVVYVDTAFTQAVKRRYLPSIEAKIVSELTGQPIVLIGLLFAVEDHARKNEKGENITIAGIKPFLDIPQVRGWLEQAGTWQP